MREQVHGAGRLLPQSSAPLMSVVSSHKFARKIRARTARVYKRAYRSGESKQHAGLMVMCFKTHGSAFDFDFAGALRDISTFVRRSGRHPRRRPLPKPTVFRYEFE